MKNLLALIVMVVLTLSTAIIQPVVAADGGFSGEYFNNPTLSGSAVLVRTDPAIDFDWAQSSPAPAINADNFSVRWTKSETFAQAGKYTFTMMSDDGAKLYIDNNLVLDRWIERGTTFDKVTIDLSQGDHQIKMEYYEYFGAANAKLKWELTGNVAGAATTAPTPQPSPSPQPTYTPTPQPTPAAQPAATKGGVSELPKTGPSALAWTGVVLMILGLKMINLSKIKERIERIEDSAKYLWNDRQLKLDS